MTKTFYRDTALLTGRSLRHITRSPDTIITTAITPIALMLMFVYVFGGAINTGPDPYVQYLLPGILLITIASSISYTAVRLFMDMKSGIVERFQSMPIARSSVPRPPSLPAPPSGRRHRRWRGRRPPGSAASRRTRPWPAGGAA